MDSRTPPAVSALSRQIERVFARASVWLGLIARGRTTGLPDAGVLELLATAQEVMYLVSPASFSSSGYQEFVSRLAAQHAAGERSVLCPSGARPGCHAPTEADFLEAAWYVLHLKDPPVSDAYSRRLTTRIINRAEYLASKRARENDFRRSFRLAKNKRVRVKSLDELAELGKHITVAPLQQRQRASAALAMRIAQVRRVAKLNARDREVLDRLAEGFTPSEVAKRVRGGWSAYQTLVRKLERIRLRKMIA